MPSSAATSVPLAKNGVVWLRLRLKVTCALLTMRGEIVMRPAEIGLHAVAADGIEKAEGLDGIAVAPLAVDAKRQAVALGDVALDAQAGVVGVLRNRGEQLVVVHQSRLIREREVGEQGFARWDRAGSPE